MHPADADRSLAEAVTRIWSQVTANTPNLDDLFERITESFYATVVRPGDTVIDGGAHTGRHALPLGHLVGPEGAVMAFEPLPAAADTLQRFLASAALDRRVHLRREALAHELGQRAFYVVHNMPEFSGLKSREYGNFVPDQSEIQVQVTTIDAVLSDSQWPEHVSFIKLDLEGGEFRALQGAEQTLNRYRPCCVFENGLSTSADGYGAREFFEFFRRLEYCLYDILGCPIDDTHWTQEGPWQFVAIPRSRAGHLLHCLWTSALKELLETPWAPAGQISPPPATLVTQPEGNAGDVIGHLDRIDMSVRVKGWAGDARGERVRSILVTIDGKPVATIATGKPRYDVVGATGIVGLGDCGFDAVVPISGSAGVEVYAETSAGTFRKLK